MLEEGVEIEYAVNTIQVLCNACAHSAKASKLRSSPTSHAILSLSHVWAETLEPLFTRCERAAAKYANCGELTGSLQAALVAAITNAALSLVDVAKTKACLEYLSSTFQAELYASTQCIPSSAAAASLQSNLRCISALLYTLGEHQQLQQHQQSENTQAFLQQAAIEVTVKTSATAAARYLQSANKESIAGQTSYLLVAAWLAGPATRATSLQVLMVTNFIP